MMNSISHVYHEKIWANQSRCAGHMIYFHCPQSRVCTTGRLCGLCRADWLFFLQKHPEYLVTSLSLWKMLGAEETARSSG